MPNRSSDTLRPACHKRRLLGEGSSLWEGSNHSRFDLRSNPPSSLCEVLTIPQEIGAGYSVPVVAPRLGAEPFEGDRMW